MATAPGLAAADADDAPVAPLGARDAVFAGILGELEARRIVPGQRLVEVDLAAAFGVSRNSVREALQRLAAEGIVDVLRHKGAAIRRLSLQDTLDVLEVAERMSGLLARAAARAVAAGADGRPLAEAIERVVRTGAGGDAEAFARARRAFYRGLLALGGNRELQRLFPAIQMPIVYAQYQLTALQPIRLRDYRAIAKAVLRGDEDAADQAATAHVRNVRAEILRQSSAAVRGQGVEAVGAPRRR